jgi:acyl-CoA synthetase (AMP-forming)/AMP-acid ligase II
MPLTNYVAHALEWFAGYGDREAIIAADRRISYAELGSAVPRFAAALREHGVRPGAAVAMLSGNRPEAIILHLAAHLLGCRTVWMSYFTSLREQADYLHRAEVEVFVYDTAGHADLGRDLMGQGWNGLVLCLGPDGLGPDLLGAGPPAAPFDTSDIVTAPASIFHTGGTTGRPKLVHQEQRFYRSLMTIGTRWLDSGLPVLKHLAIAGFYHIAGHMIDLWMLFSGGTLVLWEGFDIPDLLAVIAREQITSALFTPVQFQNLLDHPALAQADISSLLMVNIGGAALSPSRLRQGIERFGPRLRLVYGLSEAPFITEYRGVTIDPDHPQRLRSCGYVYEFADAQVEVRDGDGKPCPPGQVGEVWTAGPLVMSGYWDQPELTRDVLVDGWLRTGDVGYLESDGYLYLVDRLNDMIVTGAGALNVFTRPIEDALTSHPLVRSAAVLGVPDEAQGEAILACVITEPGAHVAADELRALVTVQVNDFHTPHRVEFVDGLPLTAVGKVDKKALRARYADPAVPARSSDR